MGYEAFGFDAEVKEAGHCCKDFEWPKDQSRGFLDHCFEVVPVFAQIGRKLSSATGEECRAIGV